VADPPVAELAGEEGEERRELLAWARPAHRRPWCRERRAAAAASVAAVLLTSLACTAPSAKRTGEVASDLLAMYRPASFMKALQEEREEQDAQEIQDEDENTGRRWQIAECVTNLNLAAWKLVQAGAVIAEATQNCPKAEQDQDRKLGCFINIHAVVASTSAATSFFASTAILCPGAERPRAECTTVLAALVETFATFPAAAGQISLFCPRVTPPPSVDADLDTRRLAALPAPATEPARAGAAARRLLTPLRAPEDSLDIAFCTWQIAQSLWFFARAGIQIRKAVTVCPPDEEEGKTKAGCAEVIGEVITQFFNGAKFVAASVTTCVKETIYPAGCALGVLNLLSALSQAAGVASALVNGACSDLDEKEANASAAIAEDIKRARQAAKYRRIRRLWSQKKLTKEAVLQALRDLGLAPPRTLPNTPIVKALRRSGVRPMNSSWPPAIFLHDRRELERLRPEVEKADWGKIEATFREWERKYHP